MTGRLHSRYSLSARSGAWLWAIAVFLIHVPIQGLEAPLLVVEKASFRNLNGSTGGLFEELLLHQLARINTVRLITRENLDRLPPSRRPQPEYTLQASFTRVEDRILAKLRGFSTRTGILELADEALSPASYHEISAALRTLCAKVEERFPLQARIDRYADGKLRIDVGRRHGISEGYHWYAYQQTDLEKVFFRTSDCWDEFCIAEPLVPGRDLLSVRGPLRPAALLLMDSSRATRAEDRPPAGSRVAVSRETANGRKVLDLPPGRFQIRAPGRDALEFRLQAGELLDLDELLPAGQRPDGLELRRLGALPG